MSTCRKCNDTGRLGFRIITRVVNNQTKKIRKPIPCDACYRRNYRDLIKQKTELFKEQAEMIARICVPDFEVRSECYG